MNGIIVLDNLRSAHNTGSIYRTAYAFGFDTIIHIGTTPNTDNHSFKRASRNVEQYIKTIYIDSISKLKESIDKRIKTIVALEITEESKDLNTVDLTLPICVILGNEALGISKQALNISDITVKIPVIGKKESLNVSVAFGIFAFNMILKNRQI